MVKGGFHAGNVVENLATRSEDVGALKVVLSGETHKGISVVCQALVGQWSIDKHGQIVQFQVTEAWGFLHDEHDVSGLGSVALNAGAFTVGHGFLAVDVAAYAVTRHPQFNSSLLVL